VSIVLPSARARIAQVPFLFRAADCIDENGIYALSYGKRVGGVFARSSPKTIVDQRGRVVRIPNGAVLPSVVDGSVALLMEPARENLCRWTEALDNAAWGKQTGTTVTPNAATAPDGTLSMDLVSHDGSIPGGSVNQMVTFTGDGEKVVSWFIREGAGDTRNRLSIYDSTATTHRHLARVTWVAGVPVLSTIAGSGTLFTPHYVHSGIWRVSISALGVVAANTNRVYYYVADASAAVGSGYAWGAQAHNAVVPSSYTRAEAATVTRAIDSLYFPVAAAPLAERSVYVRLIEQGTIIGKSSNVMSNRGSASTPNLRVEVGSSGTYRVSHNNVSTDVNGSGGATPVFGDAVEVRGVLYADGSTQAGIGINGGAEAAGSRTAANPLATDVVDRVYVGLTGSAPVAPTHVLIVDSVRTIEDLRALAGVG
jgi:hypothetical protein